MAFNINKLKKLKPESDVKYINSLTYISEMKE